MFSYCWRCLPKQKEGKESPGLFLPHPLGPPSSRTQERPVDKIQEAEFRTPPVQDKERGRNLRLHWTWMLDYLQDLITSGTLPLGLGFSVGSTNFLFLSESQNSLSSLFALLLPFLLCPLLYHDSLMFPFFSYYSISGSLFSLCSHIPPPTLDLCLSYSFLGRMEAFFSMKEMSSFLQR